MLWERALTLTPHGREGAVLYELMVRPLSRSASRGADTRLPSPISCTLSRQADASHPPPPQAQGFLQLGDGWRAVDAAEHSVKLDSTWAEARTRRRLPTRWQRRNPTSTRAALPLTPRPD